jgi:hypothetical protein
MNEKQYIRAWTRRQDINERGFYAFLQTKLNIETKEYIKSLEGRNPNTFHITSHFSDRWMMEILKDAYLKFGRKQNEFLNGTNKKAEGDDFDNAWSLVVLLLFNNILEFIVILGIIRTIKNDIKRFVDDKFSQGIPTSAIITLLMLYLTQKNIIRAQTIARTEITKIMNLASLEWAKLEKKELKKKWIVTMDGKERASHGAMADYPAINFNDKFIVGGFPMDAPGDSSAPVSELVNCRCGVMFI